MIEKKFRAWDIVRKRMLYSKDLWDIPYNELFVHTPDQRALILMQYTGLIDKNGTKIYEGDIVEFIHSGTLNVSEIKYSVKRGFYISYKYEDYTYHSNISELEFKDRHTKIVGNIYENQELLKE